MNGGLASPKIPTISGHQVIPATTLPGHGKLLIQSHGVLPIATHYPRSFPGSPAILGPAKSGDAHLSRGLDLYNKLALFLPALISE